MDKPLSLLFELKNNYFLFPFYLEIWGGGLISNTVYTLAVCPAVVT